jgi:RimJ/RimL family protein N-acetyltransferase
MDPYHFIAPERLGVDGLTIRCYYPADAEALREATLASYEHLRPWMPWATPEDPIEEVRYRCRRFYADYLINHGFVLGAWQGELLVGGTGYHLRGGELSLGVADIGLWIRASHAGQGLGTRILAALLDWGFRDWGWQRLTWHCDTRNVASARVAAKAGMVHEGTRRSDALDVDGQRRDTLVFAMTRSDWQALHP